MKPVSEGHFVFIVSIKIHFGARRSAVGWATALQVGRTIPDGVIGIFHWHNPSGRTMAMGSTQPLKEKSNRNISWKVKAAGV